MWAEKRIRKIKLLIAGRCKTEQLKGWEAIFIFVNHKFLELILKLTYTPLTSVVSRTG